MLNSATLLLENLVEILPITNLTSHFEYLRPILEMIQINTTSYGY